MATKRAANNSHRLPIESAYFRDELKSDTLLALTHKSIEMIVAAKQLGEEREKKTTTCENFAIKSLQNHDNGR